MKRTDKEVRRSCKKNKTWELFYPDGTSSLMNYDPTLQTKKQEIEFLDQLTFHEDFRVEECQMVTKRIKELTILIGDKK